MYVYVIHNMYIVYNVTTPLIISLRYILPLHITGTGAGDNRSEQC